MQNGGNLVVIYGISRLGRVAVLVLLRDVDYSGVVLLVGKSFSQCTFENGHKSSVCYREPLKFCTILIAKE